MKKTNSYNKSFKIKNELSKSQKGVALVELAIVLPLMLMLFFYFFAALRLFVTYNALGNIARIGALWASAKIPIITTDSQGNEGKSYPTCKVSTQNHTYNKGSAPLNNAATCQSLAITRMEQVAKDYARKLQLDKINLSVQITKEYLGLYATVTVATDYKDPIFGSSNQQDSKNFGMGASFSPYQPKLSFTARSYRGSD